MKNFLILLFSFTSFLGAEEKYSWPEVQKPEYSWPEYKKQDHRHILFLTQKGCAPCKQEETDEFPKMIKSGFLIKKFKTGLCNVSIVDIDEFSEIQKAYEVQSTPTFILLEGNKVVGRKVGFQTAEQLKKWYFGQVVSANRYPTRSNNWTGPIGSKESAINHLLFGGEHRGKFTRSMLEKMSIEELWALHSDDHEHRVHWDVLKN